MDGHVFGAYMVGLVEVFADRLFFVVCFYVTKVVNKPVFEAQHGLAYILFLAFVACDTVDQVGTATRDIFHSVERLATVV